MRTSGILSLAVAFGIITANFTTNAFAENSAEWNSVAELSRVSYGSIKSDVIGEINHFKRVSGRVSDTGEMKIDIDLTSVETNVDLRNERMAEHIFNDSTTATIVGEIDMEMLKALKPGDTKVVTIDATLSFVGLENNIEAEMLVARLSEDRVLVTTRDFVMLATEDWEIDAGLDKLMEIMGLESITRVAPVAVSMIFEK